MASLVTAGPGQIQITFTAATPQECYDIAVSGGPTTVTDIRFRVDNAGAGIVQIPPDGTASWLAAGTYHVAITRETTGEVSNSDVSPTTPPVGPVTGHRSQGY